MPLELELELELSIQQAVAVKFAGRINAEGVSEISWVAHSVLHTPCCCHVEALVTQN